MKEPPDKYNTIKCTFMQIFKNKNHYNAIFDVVTRTHKLVTHTYQFLRLFLLDSYRNNEDIIKITDDIIKMAFKTLLQKTVGPKPKGDNLIIFNRFNLFLPKYQKLNFNKFIDGKYLSQILNYMAVDMLTNIENNIKLNFTAYLKRFVNSSFKKINNQLLEVAVKGTKTKLRKQLNKDLFDIKQDLINNTLLANNKYHSWIIQQRENIFNFEIKHSLEFDISNNPQKYIKSMIYMCLEIEKLGSKSFQFFPLRTNFYQKYCPIDTKTLIEIFIKENKNEYLSNIDKYKKSIWEKYFNLNDKIFKRKEYTFDYKISTDCYGVSIQFINNKYVENVKNKKLNKKSKKQQLKEACQNMTSQQKFEYKNNLKLQEKQKQEDFKLKLKQEKDKNKTEFKKLSKEDKTKIKIKIQENNKIEFPYLEELTETQLNNLKQSKWLVCDPGKNSLLVMKNKDGIKFTYTNRNHIRNTKRIKYQKLLKNYKDKHHITAFENYLAKFNSKTCNYEIFEEYIKNRNELYDILFYDYNKTIFRKYKWYSYINKKRTEDKLVNTIKQKFNDTIIIMGDYSVGKSMRGILSTPNLSLKRKLAKHFTVYNLDEFRTSKLNCKTEEENDNLILPDKKGVARSIHSILTFKTESKRLFY